jgi:4'-phosphopantetheinyl transferase
MEVWVHDLKSVDLPISSLSMLGDEEIHWARQFRRDFDRHRFVMGHMMLRNALSGILGQAPEDLHFTRETTGEWRLKSAGERPVFFSLAHSEKLVAIACSIQGRLGIDVEPVTAGDLENVDGVFSDLEKKKLALVLPKDRERNWLRLWTAKEAYAKWIGRGVELEFSSLEVDLDPPRFVRCEGEQVEGVGLSFFEGECGGSSYQLALAFCQGERLVFGSTSSLHVGGT